MGPPGGAAELISVLVSLIVILGSLFIAAFVLRRWRLGLLGHRPRMLRDRTGITIIAAQSIGWQSSLQVVEAEGHRFLIGASRTGITAIGRLGPEPLLGADQRHPPAGGILGLRDKP